MMAMMMVPVWWVMMMMMMIMEMTIRFYGNKTNTDIVVLMPLFRREMAKPGVPQILPLLLQYVYKCLNGLTCHSL